MTRDERKEYMKNWYEANKDEQKAKMKAWQQEHKEYMKEYMKAYLKADVNSLGQTKDSIRQ